MSIASMMGRGLASMPAPERAEWLLAFDFDDTLHHRHEQPAVSREFFARLRELRDERGALWGINTGRSLPYLIEGLLDCGAEFLPDFVITREREIWTPCALQGWQPLGDWNQRCESDHARLFAEEEEFLVGVRRFVETQTRARWISEVGDPAGVVAVHVDEIAALCAHVDGHAGRGVELGYQRNSIYLRFCHRDYHKGSALREVARSFGLGVAQTFAMGDGHNDLEMLQPAVAARLACPANAIPEVRDQVLAHGGFAAQRRFSHGALDALGWAFGSGDGPVC